LCGVPTCLSICLPVYLFTCLSICLSVCGFVCGWQEGSGESPAKGDRVVFDWEGYTLGYYGKPFESRGKVKVG
jgi:hypothetical protein